MNLAKGRRHQQSLSELFPSIAEEWHPTRNGGLNPMDVTPGANNKVWWKCKKGHEWKAQISNRSQGRNCPYCSGNRVCEDNCLQKINPKLAEEWHPIRNGDLTPLDVTPGSNKKVWWICSRGHEWQAVIWSRNKGIGCPYCSNKVVFADNCLQAVNPNLANEWHPSKNSNLSTMDVTPGSDKKVWWICQKGHEWQARIYHRSRGKGCPYCSGRLPTEENCLQTFNPELAREWHPSKNKDLTPRDVTPKSPKKVWWKCKEGHEWQAIISNRSRGKGCPYCSGRLPTRDTCLKSVNPELAKEWHQS